jgi:hypothetical protein
LSDCLLPSWWIACMSKKNRSCLVILILLPLLFWADEGIFWYIWSILQREPAQTLRPF